MMMKNFLKHTLPGLLALTLVAGCADDAAIVDGGGSSTAGGGIRITLNVAAGMQPAGRTTLPGQENVQHVTAVALYVFKHSNGEADPAKATCIGGMGFNEVNWQNPTGSDPSEGMPTHQQVVELPKELIDPKDAADMAETYTFLAIGSDESTPGTADNATAAYGLGAATYIATGTSLDEAYARLAPGKTVDAIHRSELFAGTLTVKGEDINGKTVDMFRRVAGIKGYFRRVPATVRVGSENVHVAGLRVVYWNEQPTSVPYLKREPKPDGVFQDYGGTEATENGIPASGPISQDALDRCTYFTIPYDQALGGFVSSDQPRPETPEALSDTVTGAAYVLPAPGAVGATHNSTLYVVLVSAPDACGNVTILARHRVFFANSYETRALTRGEGVTDGGTGIIVGEDPNEEALNRERLYPIVANNYYTIGTPQEPIDLFDGRGTIHIYVDPRWEGYHDLGEIINKPTSNPIRVN